MGTKVYDNALDLITFTRASSATYLDSDGLLKTASTNVPRIEYDASGAVKGLLVEEARTNLLTYSNDASGYVVSSCTATSQDGYFKAVSNAGIEGSILFGGLTPPTVLAAVGLSVEVKAAENSNVGLELREGANIRRAYFDLTNGAASNVSSGLSTFAQSTGDGWWRISVFGPGCDTRLRLIPQGFGAVGDGVSGVFFRHWQLEAGSFPTSYIPTSGATATRAADIASIPVSAFGYNQKAGSVVVEQSTFNDVKNAVVWQIDDGTSNNRYVFNAFNGNTSVIDGGVSQASLTHTGQDVNVTYKHGFGYKLNSFASVYDGGGPVTDATGTLPTVSTLRFGSDTSTNAILNGHIKSIAYYPRRLSNAQLQELTS